MLLILIIIIALSPLLLSHLNLSLAEEKMDNLEQASKYLSKYENDNFLEFDFFIANKFKAQFILLGVLYTVIQIVNATALITLVQYNLNDFLIYTGVGFLILMFILVQVLLIKISKRLKILNKIYTNKDNFKLIVKENSIMFPIILIEGAWGEIVNSADFGFVEIPVTDIEEFFVLPSQGLKRVTPPYYKIKVKNIKNHLYITRKEFYIVEKDLVDNLKSRLKIVEILPK